MFLTTYILLKTPVTIYKLFISKFTTNIMYNGLKTTFKLYKGPSMKDLKSIAKTLSARRRELGLDQSDMRLKIGMSQQQYQRIEGGNDLRVSSLLRVLEGLGLELLFAPTKNLSDPSSLCFEDTISTEQSSQRPDDDWEKVMKNLED